MSREKRSGKSLLLVQIMSLALWCHSVAWSQISAFVSKPTGVTSTSVTFNGTLIADDTTAQYRFVYGAGDGSLTDSTMTTSAPLEYLSKGERRCVVLCAPQMEFNGTYIVQKDMEFDHNCYMMGPTYKIHYEPRQPTGGIWAISKYRTVDGNIDWCRQYYVYQNGPSGVPPQRGWINTYDDTVPDLRVAEGNVAAVSATVTTVSPQTIYYYALVVNDGTSSVMSNTAVAYVQGEVPTANLQLWLRADQRVTISGSELTGWGDISGSGNDATSVMSPVLWENDVLNGKPAVHFNRFGSIDLSPPASLGFNDFYQFGSSYHVFIVARSSSSMEQGLISAYPYFEFVLSGDHSATFYPQGYGTGKKELTQNAPVADGEPHLFSMQVSSSVSSIRIDGITGQTSSNDLRCRRINSIKIGSNADQSFFLDGDIAELLIYDSNLTTATRDSVERYLAQRYAITSGSLPVELVSFTAEPTENGITLRWKTATEWDNHGFVVERRTFKDWETIGFVDGNGNSNVSHVYSFYDRTVNGTISYRLKQIDLDGKFEYSKEVEVSITSAPTKFELAQNYPNPFNPSTTLGFTLPASGLTTLKIYDALGREAATLVNEVKDAGYYSAQFDGAKLSSGIYYAKLTSDRKTQMRKLLILK